MALIINSHLPWVRGHTASIPHRSAEMESALSSRDPAAVLALVVSAVDTQAATHDAKAARALLSSLVRSLEALLAGFHENHDFILAVTSSVVSCLRDRMVFDAEDLELRTVLWKLRFQDGDLRGSLDDYKRAADVLREASGLLAGRDSLSVQSCAEATIRIAQALLKADDLVAPNAAHDAIKRAQDIVFRKSDAGVPLVHENWILQFKACHAQIKDNNREFLVAARLYTELSRSTQFDEASILDVLLRAVRCVILAPAGHARQRVMATLARDERISLIDVNTKPRFHLAVLLRGVSMLTSVPAPVPPPSPPSTYHPLLDAAKDAKHARAHVSGSTNFV